MKKSSEILIRQLVRESLLAEAKDMKPATIESLKKWPKFYSYITAKYRDILPTLIVAIEGGGLFSKGTPHVYVPREDHVILWNNDLDKFIYNGSETLARQVASAGK